MYEDFHMENAEAMNDWLYFEPPYDPDDYLNYDDEEDYDE